MGFKKVHIIIGITLLLFSIVLPYDTNAQVTKGSEFVVVGNDIGIKSASIKHLRSIFRGKYSSWNNKQTVIIVLPSKKIYPLPKFLLISMKPARPVCKNSGFHRFFKDEAIPRYFSIPMRKSSGMLTKIPARSA